MTVDGVAAGLRILTASIDHLADMCHQTSVDRGYYPADAPAPTYAHSMGLVMTELAEVVECERKKWTTTPSEKIPEFTRLEEEVADSIIRLLDFSGLHALRIGEALMAKMTYNRGQPQTTNRVY